MLIEQTSKDARTTLSNRVALINNQISSTNDLIKKTEGEQAKMAEKVQKAKQFYFEMAQKLQAGNWLMSKPIHRTQNNYSSYLY